MTDKELLEILCERIDETRSGAQPSCKVDYLPARDSGICVQMSLVPETVTRWLDGARGKMQATFSIIAQATQDQISDAIVWLERAKGYLNQLDQLDSGISIISTTSTVPSKIGVLPDGTVRYGVTETIEYYEN